MELPDLVKLMPPILLGFGGVLPLLIATNPFPIPPTLKPLLAVIFVLVIWATFLAAYMLCTLVFYHYSVTIAALAVSVCLLGAVYFVLQPAARSDCGLPPPPPRWAFPLYVIAVGLLSIGAANYVGPTGYVVVELRVVEAATRSTIKIEDVLFPEGASEFSLNSVAVGDYRTLIMQKKLFETIPALIVQFDTAKAQDQRLNIRLNTLQFVLEPGLTARYRGQLEYH